MNNNNTKQPKTKDRKVMRPQRNPVQPRTKAAAKAEGRMAREVIKRSPPKVPTHFGLTPDEVEYHESLKHSLKAPFSLINCNIEKSEKKQSWTSYYDETLVVQSQTTSQYTMISTSGQGSNDLDPGSTPKAFDSYVLTGVKIPGGAGSSGVPGPVGTSGQPSGCLLLTEGPTVAPYNVGYLYVRTNDDRSAYSTMVPQVTECPFSFGNSRIIRWQAIAARVKVINTTPVMQRGGMGYLIQPLNQPVEGGAIPRPSMMGRGLYRAFADANINEEDGGWVSIQPRNGLCAFSGVPNNTAVHTGLEDAFAFVQVENNTDNPQTYQVLVEIDWQLAGLAVKGLASPHIENKVAGDHAERVNSIMQTANLSPSQQRSKGPGESVASAVAIHDSPALQAVISPTPFSATSPRSHPVARSMLAALGRHSVAIARSGFSKVLHKIVEDFA